MKIIPASYEIVPPLDADYILRHLESCARICYKSEHKIKPDSAPEFLRKLIQRGHEAAIEHFSFTVKFMVDRAIANEIVRHRLASYCQESTRYCNYSKNDFGNEITVIKPYELEKDGDAYGIWKELCEASEAAYFALLKSGYPPQMARAVLPLSLKTELIMTANIREWRHFLKLRTAPAAHPQMREAAVPLLHELQEKIPVLFDDIST